MSTKAKVTITAMKGEDPFTKEMKYLTVITVNEKEIKINAGKSSHEKWVELAKELEKPSK